MSSEQDKEALIEYCLREARAARVVLQEVERKLQRVRDHGLSYGEAGNSIPPRDWPYEAKDWLKDGTLYGDLRFAAGMASIAETLTAALEICSEGS